MIYKKKINNFLVIAITGPTACGKTNLSLNLSKYLPIEIISVDSGLVYKDLDIGTAKPSKYELKKIPHRLIDIKDASENYSVGEFRHDALISISEIIKNDKIPVLVGGTMLYYQALLNGLSVLPPANIFLRNKILNIVKKIGVVELHNQLKIIDPESAYRIHPNDLQRVLRALEVYFISGKTLSQLRKIVISDFPYSVIKILLLPKDMKSLHKKIEIRFNNMLKIGFQTEVEKLFLRKDLYLNACSIRRIGYFQMWKFLSNHLSYKEMIQQTLFATRKLAKHQMTWLKKWKDAYFIYHEHENCIVDHVLSILRKNLFLKKYFL
ncbi:tRNA (adenosine(37)-N6)-dimethylallyltransferase MiaA [Buchnera aphidicola (Formosaphis micheliae)]|uniref:tRNA (adenosine(37)-N6)-dimethylallyltransferase MiaA n=1 Tax=Buchnera aphidicola TaxID=9 RepID=UPI0031B86DCE